MIKLTYFDLKNALPALQKLFQQNFTNMRFLLKLKKLLTVCEKELQDFEDVRIKIVEKFGMPDKDESGNEIIKVKPEMQSLFEEELKAVLMTEVTMNVDPIPVSELEAAAENVNVEFSAVDLKLLEKFLVE